jgi:acylglycerol lipase
LIKGILVKKGAMAMEMYKNTTGTLVGKGGIELFFQSWTVEKPKGLVMIAHGIGEHSGRYMNIINRMQRSGVSFYALDHRGHGRSAGKRGHVDSFLDYLYDLKLFINFVREQHPVIPLILLGHSMGGAIACRYALTYQEDIDGLALSSAGLILAAKVPAWKISLGKFFSRHIPAFTMGNGLNANDLSHDADVVRAYLADPLVHDRISARLYTEMVGNGEECLARAGELTLPLLVFHGKMDAIIDYHGSEMVFQKAATKARDRELHVFPDLYHETMNESAAEKAKVLDAVARWMEGRLRAKPAARTKR